MESCRKAVKERLMKDMLGSIQDPTAGGWRVLVLDELTTRILSSAVRMSDILEANISCVEDLLKNREPMAQAAVYFLTPSTQSVTRLLADFAKAPLYPSVHIFFSSKLTTEAMNRIKNCEPLMRVIKSLKESNLEFITVDSRTMVTDHPLAAIRLLGQNAESDKTGAEREVSSITERLATLFATLNEFPSIRYKAGKAADPADPQGHSTRQLLAQRVATRMQEKLSVMQRASQVPARESCELLILDRSYDAVAPFIHEWTYESMVYDLLGMEGNVYRYKTESQGGKSEEKEMLVTELDEVWGELRHAFIADVYQTLANKFRDFQDKNKAAKIQGGMKDKAGGTGELSAGNIKALIAALPQFREILSRLSLHIQISSDLKTVTNERQLTDLGELEQDLVLGDKNSKDLINFLAENQSLEPADKMRLFMCYLATHPGKLDPTKRAQWMKLAKLTPQDMAAMCNLVYLGVPVMENAPEAKKGFFGGRSTKDKGGKGTRKKRADDGTTYALNRFSPLMQDILEDMVAGRLSAEEFPYVRAPENADEFAAASKQPASARQARSALNWTRRAPGGAEAAAGPPARRLVVFVIGGASRSEMRVVHALSRSLGRDIILGSTSIETPTSFTDMLYKIGSLDE
ncbi:MAG: hypothetical protein WDW36_002793 [Sanguina aurantia]